jgi:signal peptidase
MATFKKIKKLISIVGVLILTFMAVLLIGTMLPIPGNYRVLSVLSGSMEPAIHTGSVVAVAPASNYKVDDVITFGEISKTKMPTTHRIKDIKIVGGQMVYITKGDANNIKDGKEVMQNEVKGKVLFSIPYLGYILNFVRQPIGFALVIIIPAALIIWEEARKIYGEVKKDKQDKEIGKEKKDNV